MGIGRPKSVGKRGVNRRGTSSGGGGGSSATWADWEELPLDPTDSTWHLVKSGNADNSDVICDLDGGELRARFETARNYQIHTTTNNGISLIMKNHVNWWTKAGIAKPTGRDNHIFEPEAIQFKLEVQFNTDNGPIHGGGIGSYHAHNFMCVAGFSMYSSDQSGSPTAGGTGVDWGGAMLKKNLGGAPSGSSSTNMFRTGHKSRFTNATETWGTLWKGQDTAGAGANDSLIFASGPLRSESATGTWSRCTAFAGGYSTTDPFGRVWSQSFAWRDNFTRWSNDMYIHPTIFFGSNTSAAQAGEIKIKRIRILYQPIANREPLT